MKTLIKFFAAILFVALMVLNFSVDYELSPFSVQADVEMNEANARSIKEDVRLKSATCWNTGRTISICLPDPEMLCDVGAQDPC